MACRRQALFRQCTHTHFIYRNAVFANFGKVAGKCMYKYTWWVISHLERIRLEFTATIWVLNFRTFHQNCLLLNIKHKHNLFVWQVCVLFTDRQTRYHAVIQPGQFYRLELSPELSPLLSLSNSNLKVLKAAVRSKSRSVQSCIMSMCLVSFFLSQYKLPFISICVKVDMKLLVKIYFYAQ